MTSAPSPSLLEPTVQVLPGSAVSIPGVERAHLAMRDECRERCTWSLVAGLSPAPIEHALPDAVSITNLITKAAATGEGASVAVLPASGVSTSGVVVPNRSWTVGSVITAVPDPLTVSESLRTGGLTLGNAERWDPKLAALADDVARALDANVRICAVRGRVTADAFGDGNWDHPVVIAVDDDVLVTPVGEDAAVMSVPSAHGARAPSVAAVDSGQGAALIVGIREPTHVDLWSLLVDRSGFWPRLRLDLPAEPFARSEVYGHDDLAIVSELVADVFAGQFLTGDSAVSALAWWRANVLPAPRPVGVPEPPDGLHTLRGHLPCGVGFVQAEDDTLQAAVGAWVFPIELSSAVLLEALVRGEEPRWSDLGASEVVTGALLTSLGLATIGEPRG